MEIRRGLTRANTAVAVVLCTVIALAMVAGWQAVRARHHAAQALHSTAQAQSQLWKSQLAQARAARLAGGAGMRQESLEALKAAAAVHPSVELRDEGIACLAVNDLRATSFTAPLSTEDIAFAFDADLGQYAIGNTAGQITVYRAPDRVSLIALSGADAVRTLIFSPNDQSLAARFGGGAVRVWRVADWDLRVEVTDGVADGIGPQMAFSDVAEMIEDLLGLLGQQFLSGIRLTVELEPHLPRVQIGRGPLEQILLNLVVNASEAVQGHGSLTIMARTIRQPVG